MVEALQFYRTVVFYLISFSLCMAVGVKGTALSGESLDDETMMMAEALMNRGFFSEALENFDIVAAGSKNREQRAKALYFKGKINSVYFDQQEKALEIFRSILASYPESSVAPDAFFESGIILFDRKNYQKAHTVFIRFGSKYPENPRQKSAAVWADISEELYKDKRKEAQKPAVKIEKKEKATTLRVLVERPLKRIRVFSGGNIVVSDNISGKMHYSGWGPLTLAEKNDTILINGRHTGLKACNIHSDATTIKVNGSIFRGFLSIHAELDNLYTINHVDLEQYLYGVIPEEMPTRWDKQALMAQAVAARTYALCMKTKNRHEAYDIRATTAAQVYGGYAAENARTTRAVNNTKGQVMTHNGRLIVAYFHSNSGGHTEDPVNVWNVKIPYLRAVPDDFSTSAPGNTWEFYMSYSAISHCLNRNGLAVGPINRLKIIEKSSSGRNRKIQIVTGQKAVTISGNMFRASIGEAKLKSTMFTLTTNKKGVLFKGKGYGHGVGMSQWGARKMAMNGVSYQNILKYYYQNIKIVKMNNLHVDSA